MIIEHLNNHICSFTGAITASALTMNGAAIVESIIVGVSVFLITSAIKFAVNKLFDKKL